MASQLPKSSVRDPPLEDTDANISLPEYGKLKRVNQLLAMHESHLPLGGGEAGRGEGRLSLVNKEE